MGNIFWSLGPLGVFLFLVVGYGFMAMVSSQPSSWVDYLFWGMMAVGTLPAVVLLAWLQVRWLLRCLDRYIGRAPRQRFQPVARS